MALRAKILKAASAVHAVTDTVSWVENFASVRGTRARLCKECRYLLRSYTASLIEAYCYCSYGGITFYTIVLRGSCRSHSLSYCTCIHLFLRTLSVKPSRLYHAQSLKAGVLSTDNDECATGRHDCSHRCINSPGTYRCVCPFGYELIQKRQCRGEVKCLIM